MLRSIGFDQYDDGIGIEKYFGVKIRRIICRFEKNCEHKKTNGFTMSPSCLRSSEVVKAFKNTFIFCNKNQPFDLCSD